MRELSSLKPDKGGLDRELGRRRMVARCGAEPSLQVAQITGTKTCTVQLETATGHRWVLAHEMC